MSVLLFVGTSSTDTDDAAANICQPAADGYSAADDGGTIRYGAARHADPSTADPAQSAGHDAGLRARPRCQCWPTESSKFHSCCPVTTGHVRSTFTTVHGQSSARCSAAGNAAAAEDHLDRSVLKYVHTLFLFN